ncbi:hypothetical protein BU25DRAFT_446387 [Macroventuria anomochaeta]|uniref:Uncharacterized protein n=1 Tax=Macroventuria anomochaeta TaxID=301207 RepID=A0ACB6SBA1_9PLEO|nr:uncharacterized protein BU25DRAFT_446387 [Macroventuria anomochaeta]KAF2630792.1 hypothetical protein BU25DRAFT_446387 [Macroventuria anomochaeta]
MQSVQQTADTARTHTPSKIKLEIKPTPHAEATTFARHGLCNSFVHGFGIAGGVRGHRNVGLEPFHVSPSTILGVAVLRNVGCQLGVPGDGVVLSKKVGDVGEMARSKIDSGDAGSNGEAILKNVVAVRRGYGGERVGLTGDCGDIGDIGEIGDMGDVRGDEKLVGRIDGELVQGIDGEFIGSGDGVSGS